MKELIGIGCDHAGINLKKTVTDFLDGAGLKYKDFGAFGPESVDYPDFAYKVADALAAGRITKGVLLCGTGIGMSIAANRVKGVRAAVCGDVFSAKAARAHNDANILCIGERVIGPGLAAEICKAFFETAFEGGRHAARVGKYRD